MNLCKNLPNDTNEDEVAEYFRQPPARTVKRVVFGLPKGRAFIEFEDRKGTGVCLLNVLDTCSNKIIHNNNSLKLMLLVVGC